MSSVSSTTTIPVCSSCIPRAGCCTFRTSVCIPQPLDDRTVEELLETDPFAQILDVMCRHGFLWNPCTGPSGAHNVGFTESGLLTELQQTFPESAWDETNLELFLESGIQRGLLKQDKTAGTFYANQNLLNVNPKNWLYEDICAQFCAKKSCKKPTSLGLFPC
jgi:hypothetical protein